jgi:DNA-binding transcriptional LysR family regulator
VGTLAGTNLTAVLQRFTKSHPRVDLTFRTARSAEVSDLVRRGEVSIGLRYERDRSPDLQCESLGAEPLVVVCGPGHRLAGREVASLETLRDERWLAFPDVPGQREIAASHVFGLFLTRGLGEIEWTAVDSLTAQKRLVEAGFGLALMTESSITDELAAASLSTIAVRQLAVAAPVYLVTRKGGFLSQAAQRLLELLRTEYAAGWGQPKPRTRRRPVPRR